jgi:hypothetical protein
MPTSSGSKSSYSSRFCRPRKHKLRPHPVKGWVIPPKESARFVWRMEEVLDLYEEPYDPKRPVVCSNERPCQPLAEVREPLGLRAGRPECREHEYERRVMAHLFVAFEPPTGWRGVEVRERRRGREFAEFVRHLAEGLYPKAEKLRLVVDNLKASTARPPSTRSSMPNKRANPAG